VPVNWDILSRFITITPTSPGLEESIISTECFTDNDGVALSGVAGFTIDVRVRPTTWPATAGRIWCDI
jgi:hypothetical protein